MQSRIELGYTLSIACLAAALLCGLASEVSAFPSPIGTAIRYQGQLKLSGNPVNNTADFQFSLWDALTGPLQIGTTQMVNNLTIEDGLFAVELDFGVGAFGSEARWLQIAVRSPAGSGTFTTLTPRQRLRPTPASLFSVVSSSVADGGLPSSYANAVSFTNAANTFAGSGSGLTSLNASSLSSGTLPSARLSGAYSNPLTLSSASNSFTGTGSGLTSLNASNVATGTLANARTTGTGANAPNTLVLRDASGNFAAGTVTATHVGNGAGLVNLNASNIASGTLDSAHLPSSILNALPEAGGGPELAGSVNNQFRDVVVENGYAYAIRAGSPLLEIYNVSDPASPALAGSVATNGTPMAIDLSGSHAYVVTSASTLQAFNVSNPSAPALAGSVGTVNPPFDLVISGAFAYVVSSAASTLRIFNITNPSSPTMVGSSATENDPATIAVEGNLAYVGTIFGQSIQIFNVTNPAAPAPTNTISAEMFVLSIMTRDGFAYVCGTDSNAQAWFRVYDLSNLPIPMANVSLGNGGAHICLEDRFAYAALDGGGPDILHVIDVSTPADPVIHESLTLTSGLNPQNVSAGSGVLAVAGSSLQLFEFTGLVFDGPVIASEFLGDASGLTNLNASNLSGNIDNANLPTGGNWALTGALNIDSNTLVMSSTSNRVGIGTAAPTSKLHVNGDATAPALSVQVSGASKLIVNQNGGVSIGANVTPPANGLYVDSIVGMGTATPLASLHVASGSLSIPDVALENDDLIVEAADATLGLYSSEGGNAGSAIAMKEITGGALVDTWGIYRRTSPSIGGSSLRFTYGPSDNYASNPNLVTIQPNGNLSVSGTGDLAGIFVTPTGTENSSQIALYENGSAQHGTILRHDGATNQFKIFGYTVTLGESGPHLVVNRDNGRVGVLRSPAANALEVEGDASKTAAGSWLANSDARIKMNVRDLNDSLDVIEKLRPVGFMYTAEYKAEHPSIGSQEYYNVIAQEFAEVFPDYVKDSGERLPSGETILQVDTYPMLIHAVAAIQQLRAEKDAEIASLRHEQASHAARIAALEKMLQNMAVDR